MPRETLADISIGVFPLGKGGLLRIIPDHDAPELFSIVEVTGEKVQEIQQQRGPDWQDTIWCYGEETSGLTLEQAGRIIASRVQQLVYPKQITPSATPSMRRF